jgi:MFS-type transporter involved in bile tolerance (Atg22 family)
MINLILISILTFILGVWINLYATRKKKIKITQKQTKEIILKRLGSI